MRNSTILGTGFYVPPRIVTNDDLSKMTNTSDEWIRERTGIRQRHWAGDNEGPADLAKIACLVTRPSDNARLLGLLDSGRAILVAGMGPLGAVTRLAAPLLGSPFTYASLSEDAAAAPGQVPAELLDRLLREIRSWHDPR